MLNREDKVRYIVPSYLFPTIQVTPASMMNQYGAMNQYEYINVV